MEDIAPNASCCPVSGSEALTRTNTVWWSCWCSEYRGYDVPSSVQSISLHQSSNKTLSVRMTSPRFTEKKKECSQDDLHKIIKTAVSTIDSDLSKQLLLFHDLRPDHLDDHARSRWSTIANINHFCTLWTITKTHCQQPMFNQLFMVTYGWFITMKLTHWLSCRGTSTWSCGTRRNARWARYPGTATIQRLD